MSCEEAIRAQAWAGLLVTLLIVGGVALIVAVNLNLNGTPPRRSGTSRTASPASVRPAVPTGRKPSGFREYPIGEEVLEDQMPIAAVWLPPIAMEGMPAMSAGGGRDPPGGRHPRHRGEPQRVCAKDEFVADLKMRYTITPAGGGPAIHEGETVADDRPRRPALWGELAMPKPGKYRLTYAIEPPRRAASAATPTRSPASPPGGSLRGGLRVGLSRPPALTLGSEHRPAAALSAW